MPGTFKKSVSINIIKNDKLLSSRKTLRVSFWDVWETAVMVP
jgi:hypothetical protein